MLTLNILSRPIRGLTRQKNTNMSFRRRVNMPRARGSERRERIKHGRWMSYGPWSSCSGHRPNNRTRWKKGIHWEIEAVPWSSCILQLTASERAEKKGYSDWEIEIVPWSSCILQITTTELTCRKGIFWPGNSFLQFLALPFPFECDSSYAQISFCPCIWLITDLQNCGFVECYDVISFVLKSNRRQKQFQVKSSSCGGILGTQKKHTTSTKRHVPNRRSWQEQNSNFQAHHFHRQGWWGLCCLNFLSWFNCSIVSFDAA